MGEPVFIEIRLSGGRCGFLSKETERSVRGVEQTVRGVKNMIRGVKCTFAGLNMAW